MAQALVAGMAGFVVSGTFLTQGFTWPICLMLALSVAAARRAEARRAGQSAIAA